MPGGSGLGHSGGGVAGMAEIRMSLLPPGRVPREHTQRDMNQQDVLYCITATSLFRGTPGLSSSARNI